MHETHRFGAFMSLCLASVLLLVSAAVEAGRDDSAMLQVVSQPAPTLTVSEAAPVVTSQPPTTPVQNVRTEPFTEPAVSTPEPLAATAEGTANISIVTTVDTPTPAVVPPAPVITKPSTQKAPVTVSLTPPVSSKPPVIERVASPVVAERSETADTAFLRALESMIHELTNKERVKAGMAPLAYDAALARNARSYSTEMQENNFIAHEDESGCNMTCRFKADGYAAYYWGENLARWRSSYEPSVAEVAQYFVDEWKASAGHRDNLFSSDFTHEGVGASMDGNEIYVTVHFAEPK